MINQIRLYLIIRLTGCVTGGAFSRLQKVKAVRSGRKNRWSQHVEILFWASAGAGHGCHGGATWGGHRQPKDSLISWGIPWLVMVNDG